MMSKTLAGLLGLALVATGCASDDADPAGDETTPAQETTTESAGEATDDPEATPVAADACPQLSWRVSNTGLEANALEAGTVWFAEQLEERTDGQVTTEMFWLSALTPPGEELSALEGGTADLQAITQFVHASSLPVWGIASLPFITDNPEAQMLAVETLLEEDNILAQEFADQGLKPLYFKPIGPQTIGANTSMETLDDLSGLRLRSLGPIIGHTLSQVGVDPVAVQFPEIYESLERGTIDGWAAIHLEQAVIGLGVHETVSHIVDPGLGLFVGVGQFMSQETWDSLPSECQQLIEQLGDEQYETAMAATASAEQAACDEALDEGVSVTQLPEDQVEQWREMAVDGAVDSWMEGVTAAGYSEDEANALLDRYRELVEQYEGESDYVNVAANCG